MSKESVSKSKKSKEKKVKEFNPVQDKIEFDMSQFAPNGQASQIIDKGLAVVGKGGTAKAGENGAAIAGDGGTAYAGKWGVAFAGENGTAIVGAQTVAVAGKGGKASGGDGAVAIVLQNKEKPGNAEVGNGGIAYCERGGIAKVARSSIAAALISGKASADNESIIILGYVENTPSISELPATIRFQIGIIGDGKDIKITLGLKPNTLYQLDDNHNFVEAPQPKKE